MVTSKKIKLLYIIDSPVWGGAEIYIYRLARTLKGDKYSYDIGIVVPVNSEVGNYFRNEGINVFEAGIPTFRDIKSLKAVYRVIKNFSPDIVHINMPSPYNCFYGGIALIAKLAGVKKIIVSECLVTYKGRFLRPILKRFFSIFVDKFIALTKTNAIQMNKLHYIPNKKIFYTGFGVEQPVSIKSESKLRSNKIVIANIGRLEDQKRQDLFLQVARKICEKNPLIEFRIFGKGLLEKDLKQKSIELNIENRIKFIGFLENRQEIFSNIDILLVTSLRDPLPVIIIEAMSYKKPVIAFDIDSIHEAIIDNENGFLVPPGDLDFMADRALTLINNTEKSAKFGEKGYELFIDRFLLETMVEKTHQLYLY